MLLLPIGSITKSHGIDGEFIVNLFSEEIDLKNNIRKVWLGESLSHTHSWSISDFKVSSKSLFLTLRKIDTAEEANYLKGLSVYLPKENIVGSEIYLVTEFDVFSSDDSAYLGSITNIDNRGKQPFFIIEGEDEDLILPAVEDLIDKIDWNNRKLYYKSKSGLF